MDLEGPQPPKPPKPATPGKAELGRHRAVGSLSARIKGSLMGKVKAAGFASIGIGAVMAGVDPRAPFATAAGFGTAVADAGVPRAEGGLTDRAQLPQPLAAAPRRVGVHSETVALEMASLVGHAATWVPSGPGSGNTFEQWVSAPTEGPPPPLDDPSTTINCWEMVLYSAYRSNAVNWSWLHELYREDNISRSWFDEVVQRMTPEGTAIYDAGNPVGPQPERGDIVFWNGCSHVGLALGTRDAAGRQEVLSFWPPPDKSSFPGTTDVVKRTTIEELAEYMEGNYMGRPHVTFGPAAW